MHGLGATNFFGRRCRIHRLRLQDRLVRIHGGRFRLQDWLVRIRIGRLRCPVQQLVDLRRELPDLRLQPRLLMLQLRRPALKLGSF